MSQNASLSISLTVGAVTAVSQQAVQGGGGLCGGGGEGGQASAEQMRCCSGQLQGYNRSNLTTSLNTIAGDHQLSLHDSDSGK